MSTPPAGDCAPEESLRAQWTTRDSRANARTDRRGAVPTLWAPRLGDLARRTRWPGERIAGSLFTMGNGEGDDKDYVVSHVAYDPETTLIRAEVVIGLEGGGGVSTSFFQFRGSHDREAEAALVRQAAEMLLEHAENLRNRPDPRHRPPE